MRPIALLDLAGRYAGGEVSLTWRFPPNASEAVFICPVYGNGSERRVNIPGITERMLRDAPDGTRFRHQESSPYDVTRSEYLVFLGSSGEQPSDIENFLDEPGYTVIVTAGTATVFYRIKTQRVEGGLDKHLISLRSDYSIESGILGYSFSAVGRRFSAVLPGAISRGKHKYPPFYTYQNAGVTLEVVGGANADVICVPKKRI
jgi:hypothetical protein